MVSEQNEEQDFMRADITALYSELNDENDHFKSADIQQNPTEDILTNYDPNPKLIQANTQTQALFPTFSSRELSVCHCFSKYQPLELWNSMKEFFDEAQNVDPEANEEAKVVSGNFYKNTQDCSFLASVASLASGEEEENRSVVDVRRIQGDAFALNDFFKVLRKHLIEADLVEPEDELMGDDDDDMMEDYSDLFMSEDEGEDDFGDKLNNDLALPTSLDPFNHMMDFSYDPDMLYMMIEDFKDTHQEEKQYYMSMLSHNAQLETNRQLILQEERHSQVKELIEHQLGLARDRSSASLTRNTCVFLKNLACDLKIDEAIVKAALEAMGEWCPGSRTQNVSEEEEDSVIGELSGSRQSMIEICQFFQQVLKFGKYTKENLVETMQDTLTMDQINRISEFTSNYDGYHESLSEFGAILPIACN